MTAFLFLPLGFIVFAMKNTSAPNNNLTEDLNSSKDVPVKAEGIALCSAFMLTFVLVVSGNLLTIILFVKNKNIRKKHFFLPINMAFADLLLGTLGLPMYIYQLGIDFQLWNVTVGFEINKPLYVFFRTADTFVVQASLISAVFISCERFHAINWPFKHRTLSTRTYCVAILTVWILALIISAICIGLEQLSVKYTTVFWGLHTLILILTVCGCNLSIWREFKNGSASASRQQNGDRQNKRLTRTLLFISGLTLLAWMPLVAIPFLIDVSLPSNWKFNYVVNLFNYFNSFVNAVVYALKITEFRQAFMLFRKRATRGQEKLMSVITSV